MSTRSPWSLGLVACWLGLTASLSGAAELSLVPDRDTSLFSGGGYETRSDGAGEYLWVSVTAGGINRRALVRFDTTSIPIGSTVREVTLSLYESRARNEHAVRVHRVRRAWGEGTSNGGGSGEGAPATPGDATWLHTSFPDGLWAQAGGDFEAIASAVTSVGLPGVFYRWESTPALVSDVQAWVNDPAANHGWILIGDEQGLQNAKRFESRNNATATNRPRLVVVYDPPGEPVGDVPLPAWALAAIALLLAARLARPSPGP